MLLIVYLITNRLFSNLKTKAFIVYKKEIMDRLNSDKVAQIFVILLIVVIGGVIFFEITPFLPGVLGTITLFAILKNYQIKLENLGLKPMFASLILIVSSIVIILIPLTLIAFLLSSKISLMIENSDKIFAIIKDRITSLESHLGFELLNGRGFENASTWISKYIGGFANSTFTTFIAIAIMYFLLYYLLKNRKKIKTILLDYVPVSKKNLNIIWSELEVLIKSNSIGIPLVALSQGIISLIGFLIIGAPDPLFWFVIATITSLVPYGTALAIGPVAILLFSQGDNWPAMFIIIYGIVVVGSTDNLLRMTILRKLEDVHPLITLVGVIIGIPLFGFIGIIFGPVMISMFLLIVKLYKKEYS